jgi:hypothetical protein
MSHFKVEVSRKRRVFSEEFRQDAVRLVVSENYTIAAEANGAGEVTGANDSRPWTFSVAKSITLACASG